MSARVHSALVAELIESRDQIGRAIDDLAAAMRRGDPLHPHTLGHAQAAIARARAAVERIALIEELA